MVAVSWSFSISNDQPLRSSALRLLSPLQNFLNQPNTCHWFHGFQVWPLVQKQEHHQRTCYKRKPMGSTPELLIQKREGQQYVFEQAFQLIARWR